MTKLECAGRSAWAERRRSLITSTRAAAIAGLDPWETPLHVYHQMVGQAREKEVSPVMTAGLLLEPLVDQLYQRVRPNAVFLEEEPYTLFSCDSHEFVAASIDRMTTTGELVERKTVESWQGWGPDGTDQVPDRVLLQVQVQLLCTGSPVCDVAALHRGTCELRVYPVVAHEELQKRWLLIAEKFWERVLTRSPPDPMLDHPHTKKLLDSVLRPEAEVAIPLPPECLPLVDEYLSARADARDAEKRKEVALNALTSHMGTAGRGELPDGTVVFRREVKAGGYVVPARSYVRMDIRRREA